MLEIFTDYPVFWIVILIGYIFAYTSFISRKLFEYMLSRDIRKKDALYYNRKFMHIFGGGVVVLLVPLVFDSAFYPLLAGLVLAVITFVSHKKGNRMYWFQSEGDFNDVNFCFMWGLSIFIVWELTGSAWVAILPSTFMALGDGITGIVRNLAFRERSKHPIGNIYMVALCIPFAYYIGKFSGIDGMVVWAIIAAVVASVVERFEIWHIDDNVFITLSASAVLLFGYYSPFSF